nr:Fe3+ hydroxamate ABC transporter substrate-binding protein [Anoxybacillus vitaminiphilus]
MFNIRPMCSICGKNIEGNALVYIQMRYPERRGITEIKAYIQNEGKIICENCFSIYSHKSTNAQ